MYIVSFIMSNYMNFRLLDSLDYSLNCWRRRLFFPRLRIILRSTPCPSLPQQSHQIHQTKQYRDFNKWSHRRRQRLITMCPKRRNGNRNGQFEIITRSSETLYRCKFVIEMQSTANIQCCKKDDCKVDNEWSRDTDDKDNLVDDVATLRCEENYDGEEETYERERCNPIDEASFVILRSQGAN